MPETNTIEGVAAPLPFSNLDTDQIMPKQFLRIIDKAGLDKGLLHDLRFDAAGKPIAGFVLNQPAYQGTKIIVAGPNFGCGSSREHAVWGLQQYGIQAVLAASFGEIFYFNAQNNQLLLVTLPEKDIEALLRLIARPHSNRILIDVAGGIVVDSLGNSYRFEMTERHRRMFLEGLDMVGATMEMQDRIEAFEAGHWARSPWARDVAQSTRARLDGEA